MANHNKAIILYCGEMGSKDNQIIALHSKEKNTMIDTASPRENGAQLVTQLCNSNRLHCIIIQETDLSSTALDNIQEVL